MSALRLDAVLAVKLVHRVEPGAETTGRDDDVDVVRKFLLDPRCSELTFITGHTDDHILRMRLFTQTMQFSIAQFVWGAVRFGMA